MSVQAINQQALGPAAKGLYTGSGRVSGSTEGATPRQAAEADERSARQALQERLKEATVPPPAMTQLQFNLDCEHRRVFIKVTDAQTGEVLLEVPPEKVARALDQLIQIAAGPSVDLQA